MNVQRFETMPFVETRTAAAGDLALARFDPIEQIAQADRADWALLKLVLCAGVATLLLALASTLR
jgi:hypothetical protein